MAGPKEKDRPYTKKDRPYFLTAATAFTSSA
jgi:hypothetical protein